MRKRKTLNKNCEVCGTPYQARVDNIANGYGRFCSKQCAWQGFESRTHGHATRAQRTPTYRTWKSMHWRCNTSQPNYENVSVCERWSSFESFLADVGERPEGKTLDRFPDPFGNHEPGNVRWATPREQAQNRRGTVKIDLHGKSQCVSAWARELGMPVSTIKNRLNRGLAPELILNANRPQQSSQIIAAKDFFTMLLDVPLEGVQQ